jgi:hypothetical protein
MTHGFAPAQSSLSKSVEIIAVLHYFRLEAARKTHSGTTANFLCHLQWR